jgi:hypothetical protein
MNISQIPLLKGGRFDIHFHRRDAEHAEDLINFLLSAERAESKNQQPFGASTCYCQRDTLISALFVNRS